MDTYEFSHGDGMVDGTVSASDDRDAVRKLSATEVGLWKSVWLRRRGQTTWWEIRIGE